jgi:hypothetical protein
MRQPLALHPYSSVHLGWNLWEFGLTKLWFGTPYWWIQLEVLVVLSLVYIQGAWHYPPIRSLRAVSSFLDRI